MNVNQEQFKSILQRDKIFLKELYESNSRAKSKNILTFATDGEITTLVKYIHFVANGIIKIKKQNFDAIGQRHLSFSRKHFESKASLHKLNQCGRKDKMKVLLKFIPIYNHLLAPLFNQ